MRFSLSICVLILQVCYLESRSPYRQIRRARIKDAFLDARKIAEAEFTDLLLGRSRRSVSDDGNGYGNIRKQLREQKLLEDFEVIVYARRLSSLLKKRSCTEWWCMSDKATSKTVPTTVTPPPPTTTAAAVKTEIPPKTLKPASTTPKVDLTSTKPQPSESQSSAATIMSDVKTTRNNTQVSVVVTLTTPVNAAPTYQTSVLEWIGCLPVLFMHFHWQTMIL